MFFRALHSTPNLSILKDTFRTLDWLSCRHIALFYTTTDWKVKMSGKTARGGKAAGRPLADTMANVSRAQASKNSPNKLLDEDEDDLPLAWQKLSKTLL